jgi:hypothetical protein
VRAVLPLAVLCLACSAPVRELTVVPSLPDNCLGGRAVNQVKITALGDFPPAVLNVASAEPGAMARLELPKDTRVVQVEGFGEQGALVGFGRTAPLSLNATVTELPIAYGPRDTLCPTRRLNYSRSGHRATLLSSGQVLISGGVGADGFPVARLELYVTTGDLFGPAATFRIVDPNGTTTIDARASLGHTATVLSDGSVLLAGGSPVDGGRASGIAFEGAQRLRSDGTADGLPGLLGGGPRAFHSATRLGDGRVLLAGGCSELDAGNCSPGRALASTVIFDARTGLYAVGPVLKRPRYAHEAILRGDGAIVLLGGHTEGPLDPPVELVDPNEQRPFDGPQVTGRGALLPTGALATLDGVSARLVTALAEPTLDLPDAPEPRTGATVTALEDGAWLVAGGNANNAPLLLYDGRGNLRKLAPFTRSGHTATRLLDGTVLMTGGGDPGMPASTSAEIFLRSQLGPFSTLPVVTFDGTQDDYLPRRPDRVTLNGGLRIAATSAGESGRPAELALLPALDIDGLSISVLAGRQGVAGAALLFAWQSDASYAFVTLEPGMPVRLMRVEPGRSGQSLVSEVCAGEPLADAELPDGTLTEVKLEHRLGQLEVGTVQRSFVRCTPERALGRGQVGVGALYGTVTFDNLAATR